MKFQDSSFNGLKVTVCTKSVTHTPTNGRSKSNMPYQLFQSWGHKDRVTTVNDVSVGVTGHNLHAQSPQEAEVEKSMPAKLRSSIGGNKK